MTTRQAIVRLCQEIYLMSDNPGYVIPNGIRRARAVLNDELGISEDEIYSYPKEDENV